MIASAPGGFWSQVALRRHWLAWGALTLAWFVLVYGGCDWLTSQRDHRVRLHLDAELGIPLIPAAALVYLSLTPFMWVSGFALGSPQEWRALALTMMTAIGLAGIGFLVLPANVGYEPWQSVAPVSWHGVFSFTDRLVGSHNLFPSLHVAFAWICAAAYCGSTWRRFWPLWILWATVISVATLFCHQHHVIDLFGGAALGWLCASLVYFRASRVRPPKDPEFETTVERYP